MKKTGLGRGLGSLIPKKEQLKTNTANNDKEEKQKGVLEVEIDKIKANPFQPRKDFKEDDLNSLMLSVKKHGIIQPLVVTLSEDGYELIAGERRLRAAKLAGLKRVPAILKEVDDFQKMHFAIIENVQRSDLNPIEEALAYKELSKKFNLTHEEIAKEVGKSRSYITNTLRLLNLPSEIQEAVRKGKLSTGQARSLISLPDEEREKIFQQILDQKMNVRDVEEKAKKVVVKNHIRTINKNPNLIAKEDLLKNTLGTKVLIKEQAGKGKIMIDFYSFEELEEIIKKIIE